MESNIACSTTTWRGKGSMSILTRQTMRTTDTLSILSAYKEEGRGHLPVRHPFEEDLNRSWVYQRAMVRGPQTFSIATSTKLTQSWSILSGLSLSAVSNLAVCALPVYKSDLQNSDLYPFNFRSPVPVVRILERKSTLNESSTTSAEILNAAQVNLPSLQPVSWLAECLVACDIPIRRPISGIPYLTYRPSEVGSSSKVSGV
jgi:hypothetical protein